jgi:hypothetical protein
LKQRIIAIAISVFISTIAHAQDQNSAAQNGSAETSDKVSLSPVIAGGMAFDTTFSPGTQVYSPSVDPIFLLPLGTKWMLESELSISSDLERDQSVWQPRQLNKEVEYLQLDYIVNNHVTFVAGKIMTPFGIYMERYHPEWIRDIQIAPIIFGISHNQSMGAEMRGATHLAHNIDLTYTGFYAVNSTARYFEGERAGGGRTSLVFSRPRIEVGFSYERRLGDDRFNLYGWDFTWNARAIPLDIRSEVYKTGLLGTGYWIEPAYRLNKVSSNTFIRKSQVVFREEQYFAPRQFSADQLMNMPGDDNYLPDRETTRLIAGWNYYVTDAIKLSAAYGRSLAFGENQNLYSLGVTFRFTRGER